MKKAIRFTIKLFLAVQLLTIESCGDEFALTEKYYFVKEKNKEWLVTDSLAKPYEMIDSYGITYSFSETNTQQCYSEGASGFLFVTTKKSYVEYYQLSSTSNYGTSFSMNLYASLWNGSDDVIHLYFDNITLHCDLTTAEIYYFGCKQNNAKWTQTDENDKNSVFVKAEFLDSINLRSHVYNGILHCKIKDNINVLDDTDIIEIYYAKRIGLIKYIYKSGIVVERKPGKKPEKSSSGKKQNKQTVST